MFLERNAKSDHNNNNYDNNNHLKFQNFLFPIGITFDQYKTQNSIENSLYQYNILLQVQINEPITFFYIFYIVIISSLFIFEYFK